MLKRIACIVMSAGLMVPVVVVADPTTTTDQGTTGTTGINGNNNNSGAPRTVEQNPTNARVKADADGQKTGSAGQASGDKSGDKMAMDKKFAMEAASGGMLEVQLGQYVQQHGQSEQAKNVAKMMVEDHTKANEQLMACVQKKGVMIPKELNEKDRMTLEKMQKMEGSSLDRAYLMAMVEDHKNDIKNFQNEAQNGQDPEVKMFAQNTLPTLQAHLMHVQQAITAMGGDTTDKAQSAGQKQGADKIPEAGKTGNSNQGNSGINGNLSPATPTNSGTPNK